MEYREQFEKATGWRLSKDGTISKQKSSSVWCDGSEYLKAYNKWLESKLTEQREKMYSNMQQYLEYCTWRHYITPQDFLTSLKQQD